MSYKNKQILIASCSILALSFSYNVHAQLCSAPLSCEELGFTDTADKCDGDAMIKCPTDYSKVFCRAYLPTTATKTCDTIGDILLDNKSCAVDANAILQDRTPIGVVYDVSRKLAIALMQSNLQWASKTVDIPDLTNYSKDNVTSDYNGKSNTSIIIAHGYSDGYETPAADYCYNYTTKGTNKGDWYLPAGGELQLMYNNKTTLNNSLSKVGGTQLPSDYLWSSSEYSFPSAWYLSFDNGNWGAYKLGNSYVRPVLAY